MDKKRKIAFVISKLSSGGAQRVIATLANNLIHTFDITIITYSNQTSFYKLDENIKVLSCFESNKIQSSKNFIQSIKLNYRIYRAISDFLREKNIELVIGFITQSNVFSILAAKKNKIPSIICERTNPKLANIQRFWRILRKLTYPKADRLVVQTDFAKSFYEHNVSEKKIITLPNPLNPELSNKRIKGQKENIILAVGRLRKLKNHSMAIKSFSQLNSRKWKLQILGEGPERKNLEKLISNNPNIELLGAKTNIEDYYNKARIFLFTSYYEGFPNALLEAMHFGLTPISTNCNSGPSEIIDNKKNGFLVNIGDCNKMAEHLKELTEDQKLLEEMSIEAMKTTEKYSSENITQLWKDLIDNTLN
ncbi:glycosyltransferase family 4 protein [Flagellimonas sp. CMM7]|uniref:glycosyltransferase family 4 protein n=1 Tax=Flagellimonas sp. CMM7 TaxID=2654676 RepID=UPI0013D1D33D|nr:glycosyltransferase family 4 protein [Flagellimonas sp. CMM7]UII79911.1 glycosyltransferase family 4 protein [Flagellimonas sp. CMM7]